MDVQELFKNMINIVSGDFNDLTKFNFEGVYIICDGDEVVYIGSAYPRTIKERLRQYLSPNDTGNTLGKTIAKGLANSTSYDENAKKRINDAVNMINNFSVYAIEYKDLEYNLIKLAKPKYNNIGKNDD